MKGKEQVSNFSIIFDKIDEFNETNPNFNKSFVTNEEIEKDEAIKEFGRICEEIEASTEIQHSTVFI